MGHKTVTADARRVDQIISDFLRGLQSGRVPDEQELIRSYPECADELREFFAELRRFEVWENEGGALPTGPQ